MIPEKWYLPITIENFNVCKQWRDQFETSHDHYFSPNNILLSEHYRDKRKLYIYSEQYLNENRPEYKKITTEDFIKYVLNKEINTSNILIQCL